MAEEVSGGGVMKKLFILFIFWLGWFFFWLSVAGAADVTLQWDANTDPDLAGYYIYQAERIGDKTTAWQRITPDLVTETTFVVIGLDDKNYAWLATAIDTAGNESFVSNMVERYDRTPPSDPKNLRK